MIRFNLYIGKGKIFQNDKIKNIKTKLITQPELSNYNFYGNLELDSIDTCIANKFIKKTIFIKVLNSLENIYLNLHITYMEDTLVSYILYKVAKSYLFLHISGYYYIRGEENITTKIYKISHLQIKSILYNLKIIFDFSKNTKYEKDPANLRFTQLSKAFFFDKLLPYLYFNKDFYLYYNIINLILKSPYFSQENKKIFEKMKFIIKKKIIENNSKNSIKKKKSSLPKLII